ncbi:hypothetical protein V7O61_06520 [Methanolobus sp. WCC1]|uniref:hypothetical protein n=1 Tax=unclassified Methanolobus TaxID=2629569 RepID=UPI0032517579
MVQTENELDSEILAWISSSLDELESRWDSLPHERKSIILGVIDDAMMDVNDDALSDGLLDRLVELEERSEEEACHQTALPANS